MAEQENDTARFILPNLSLTAPSPHWPLYSTWTRSIPQRYTFKLYTFQPRNKPVEHSEEQQKNRYERGKIDRI